MTVFKKIALTFVSFTLLMGATSAMANIPIPTAWYVEGNVGFPKSKEVNVGDIDSSIDDASMGWNANVGYKFNPFFATEIGYTFYGDAKAKSDGTEVAKVKEYAIDLAGKGMLPISNSGFDLFAKVGIAEAYTKVSAENSAVGVDGGTNNSTGLYLGIGAEYAFLPNLEANLQWTKVHGGNSTGTFELYSIGLAYLWG